jgi:predicted nucleotidyltransferase
MTPEIMQNLREREKELNCLYRVHEILRDEETSLSVVLKKVVHEIPNGWQYPGICMARIEVENIIVTSPGFFPTQWYQKAYIMVEGNKVGNVEVFYAKKMSKGKEDVFLAEEQQLLNTISQHLSQHIFNRKLKESIQYLNEKSDEKPDFQSLLKPKSDEHWKWRYEMAQTIAEKTTFKYYGIQAIYIIGSVKEATAGAKSDIDLLIHFEGSEEQKNMLKSYFDGWSQALADLNYRKTGQEIKEGLIDLHIITSADIEKGENSFAAMIKSHSNSARILKQRKH